MIELMLQKHFLKCLKLNELKFLIWNQKYEKVIEQQNMIKLFKVDLSNFLITISKNNDKNLLNLSLALKLEENTYKKVKQIEFDEQKYNFNL